MKLVFALRAQRDIADIYNHIARRSELSAQRVESAIRTACDRAAEFPLSAPLTDEANVRRVPIARYPYSIFYRFDADRQTVEIARIVYSGRVRDLGQIPD